VWCVKHADALLATHASVIATLTLVDKRSFRHNTLAAAQPTAALAAALAAAALAAAPVVAAMVASITTITATTKTTALSTHTATTAHISTRSSTPAV